MMPLEGYRLLDLSRLQPGPSGTHILADLGMEVVKVEEPEPRGGMGRDVLTPVVPTPETEVLYSAYNAYARNKKSIAINLRTDEGREVLHTLARTADAFLEGYRPGVMKRLGCDYETLSRINPRLVYCSLSGYGQDGPYVDLPGHDPNYCSIAGQLALQRDAEGNPVPNGVPMADIAGGVHAALGIMAALMAREKTGRGQFVDVTLTHSVMSWMVGATSNFFRDGPRPRPAESLTVLKCKDGRYLTVANAETHFWRNFCNAIGRPDFFPLHRRNDQNAPQFDQMAREIRAIMLTRTRDEWFQVLARGETCVAPILELDELFDNPANRHRGMLLELEHPVAGRVRQIGPVIGFSDTPFEFRGFAPVLGEQTVELLREAGYSAAQVDSLIESGAVKAWREPVAGARA